VFLAQSQPAVPDRLHLTSTSQPAEPTPGIEAPALYDILRQFKPLPTPPESHGLPYDRNALLSRPQALLGSLIATHARYIETKQVRLADSAEDHPAFAWSTLATDPGRDPIQVLSFGPRPQFRPLANVRCVGYFYKVRVDRAAAPGRNGSLPDVKVPVLVGWVLPASSASSGPSAPVAAWQIFGVAVAAAMVLFFVMFAFVRRRADWRMRLARRRPRSWHWPDQTEGT
jgi:hypothetical protein